MRFYSETSPCSFKLLLNNVQFLFSRNCKHHFKGNNSHEPVFIPDLIPTKHNLTFESQKRTKPTENGLAAELRDPAIFKQSCKRKRIVAT